MLEKKYGVKLSFIKLGFMTIFFLSVKFMKLCDVLVLMIFFSSHIIERSVTILRSSKLNLLFFLINTVRC